MERPLQQHTFLFMYLCLLPDDGRIQCPKHVVQEEINENAEFEFCGCLDLKHWFDLILVTSIEIINKIIIAASSWLFILFYYSLLLHFPDTNLI